MLDKLGNDTCNHEHARQCEIKKYLKNNKNITYEKYIIHCIVMIIHDVFFIFFAIIFFIDLVISH